MFVYSANNLLLRSIAETLTTQLFSLSPIILFVSFFHSKLKKYDELFGEYLESKLTVVILPSVDSDTTLTNNAQI